MERKFVPLDQLKLPQVADEMRFSGYGAVFGNVDAYGDVIAPGAFAQTLADAQKSGIFPAMLMQHGGMGLTAQDMVPIGVWDKLSEDGHGLVNEGVLAPTPRGQEAYALMKMAPRPAITGMSIGYKPIKFTMRSKAEDPRRTLHEVALMEVSLVTFPANSQARITGVKSIGDFTDRDFEQLMQDAGLSRKEARVVMNHGFRHLKAMQDAGDGELSELVKAIKRNIAAT